MSCMVFVRSSSPRAPEHIRLFSVNSQLLKCETLEGRREEGKGWKEGKEEGKKHSYSQNCVVRDQQE